MAYYNNLESNNPHRKYILLLMNKIVLLVFLHGVGFAEKEQLSVPESISNTAPSHALVCNTTSSFICFGKFNYIWLSVISIFYDPVYDYGDVVVSYIAQNTCDNYVIAPMYELPL